MIDDCTKPESYVQFCFLKPIEVEKVSKMIASRVDFSNIGIEISPNREEFKGILPRCICEDDVLVTLRFPFKGISMSTFYEEMCKNMEERKVIGVQGQKRVNISLALRIRNVLFG